MSPVRKIRPNYRSLTGHVTRGPQEPTLQFESTLERDFYEVLTFGPAVENIETQPFRVTFLDAAGQPHNYVPDCRFTLGPLGVPDGRRAPFLREESRVVCEIKYRSDLRRDWKELRARFRACRALCAQSGWTFRIYTEREIRTPLLRNAEWLRGYGRAPARLELRQEIHRILLSQRQSTPARLLAELLRARGGDDTQLRELWSMLASGEVQMDYCTPLDMDSTIWSLARDVTV